MMDDSRKGELGSLSFNITQNSVESNGHCQNGHTAAPQLQSQTHSPVPNDIVSRGQWGGKYEFLLSCLGYCVGLGNVWRFPYLCYRNGGGVFLIPYFIMLFVTGVPLFLMELCLGQYGAAGPITVWKCCPLLKGIGIGMLCVAVLVSLYYNVIIAWTFYYLGSSFQSPLPWSCDAVANAAICNGSSGESRSPSEIFWNERVLGVVNSEGLHDPGQVRMPLALCLLAAWIIVFLCMIKGIHSAGKVVYVTATFPYFVLIVLIIRGATLEGSLQGIAFYLTPDWRRITNAQVWNDAASQIFYSLGIGVGGVLSMASYNKFDNNVIRSGTSFCGLPRGPCSTPRFGDLFGNIEGITTAVLDEFPQLRRNAKHKSLFLAGLCFCFYLMGLLLVTDGGIYWVTLIDSFSTSFGLIIITLFMCTGVSFFYGVNQFCQDIIDMIRHCPPWCSKVLLYFKACWVFFTPFLLLFILTYIFMEMYNTSLNYGDYVYPRWGKALGVCMGTTCCMQIVIWAIVAIYKETGTLKERFCKSIRPLNSWRTNNGAGGTEGNVNAERVNGLFTVTLTNMDFNAMTWEEGRGL
ncbi:sodium-dependent proline transporter isoform X2 [Stigmatopora argus]